MSYTELKEVIEWLKSLDEVQILELLEIGTQDLVDAFMDKVIDNQAKVFRIYVENQ